MTSIDDRYLPAFGKITVNFAALEENVALVAGQLISAEQAIGRIVTAQLPFKQRIDLLGSLVIFRVKDENVLAELQSTLNLAGMLEDERNLVIHSVWLIDQPEQQLNRMKVTARKKKGLSHRWDSVSHSDLDGLAERILTCANDFMKMLSSLTDVGVLVRCPDSGGFRPKVKLLE